MIREAQEIVELCTKGMLRFKGIDVPKQHDVSYLLIEYKDLFPGEIVKNLGRIAEISKYLRKEIEFALYGDIDFIPTEEYKREDAEKAMRDTEFVVEIAERLAKALK